MEFIFILPQIKLNLIERKSLFSFLLILFLTSFSYGATKGLIFEPATESGLSVSDSGNPVANDDTASTSEDTSVTTQDVFANDTIIDGASISSFDSTSVNGGVVTYNGDGTFNYTPATGFVGDDTFTYTLCNNDTPPSCSSATVTITVNGVNTPPTANDDYATVDQNTSININVTANDTDNDGYIDVTKVSLVNGPSNGTIVIDTLTGQITYTPNNGFSGQDNFKYVVCDNENACDTAIVTISVIGSDSGNPVANEDTISTSEDTTITTGDVLANDTVIDGATITSFDMTTVNGGTVISNGDGTFNYTPATGFVGDDTFTYTLCDDDTPATCSTATVTITVSDTGNPVAIDDMVSTNEDTTIITSNVLENDTIIDGATITSFDATSVYGGTVTYNGNGTFNYTPATSFVGDDTFTYTLCDDDTPASCSTATVTITVSDSGNPVAINDTASTDEDTTIITSNVLVNDTVIDGATITSFDPTSVNGGTLTSNGDGTFNYTPANDFVGDDKFTYTLCDDDTPASCSTATVTISVRKVNTPPTAIDDQGVTDYNTPITINVIANDSDDDGSLNLTSLTIVNGPTNGTAVTNPVKGEITYTPNDRFSGQDSFEYSICDDENGRNTAKVTIDVRVEKVIIEAIDDFATIPFNETTTFNVLSNDLFPSADNITISRIGGTAIGNLTIDTDSFEFIYLPELSEAGKDVTIEYKICYELSNGDSICDTATLTVSVPPVISLSLINTVNNLTPVVGEEIEFMIDVQNEGPNDATGVTVLDIITTGYEYINSQATVGSYDESTGIWTIGEIKNGGSETLTIRVKVNDFGNYTNIAEVYTADQYDLYSKPNNGIATEIDQDEVTTEPITDLFIPKQFTPNGDGINDVFIIENLEALFPNFAIEIVNRWGNKVYKYEHTGNPNSNPMWWDGYSNGRLNVGSGQLPVGTYFYTIYFNDGKTAPMTNWIYLKR